MRMAGALATCMLLVAVVAYSDAADADSYYLPTGSKWKYWYNETVTVPRALYLSIDGIWKYECWGLTNLDFPGSGPEVLLFYSSIKADVTGRMAEYIPFFGTYWWMDVAGELTITELEYYDLETGMPVRTVLDEKLDITASTDPRNSLMYYEEHNETNYTSVSIHPPDIDVYQEDSSPTPGTEWTVVYLGTVTVEGIENNTDPFSRAYDLHAHVNYTYVEDEDIDVPAGSFACRKIHSVYADADVTEWYSPEAEGNARMSASSEGDEVVCSLVAYDLHEERVGGNGGGLDVVILAAAAVAVIGAVVGTLALYLWKQKRPPAPQNLPAPTEELPR